MDLDVVGIGGGLSSMISTLGNVVGVVVGGYFAFKLAKIALRWSGRIGGNSVEVGCGVEASANEDMSPVAAVEVGSPVPVSEEDLPNWGAFSTDLGEGLFLEWDDSDRSGRLVYPDGRTVAYSGEEGYYQAIHDANEWLSPVAEDEYPNLEGEPWQEAGMTYLEYERARDNWSDERWAEHWAMVARKKADGTFGQPDDDDDVPF